MSKPKSMAKCLLLVATMASIVGCDRVTKHLAIEALAGVPTRSYLFDVIRLGYSENAGSFLSLGQNLPGAARFAVFVLGSAISLLALLFVAIRFRWSGARLAALALIVAGGGSNLADRLADGHVVDFLNMGIGPVRTGIFNVADVAIMAGAAILVLGERGWRRKRRHDESGST